MAKKSAQTKKTTAKKTNKKPNKLSNFLSKLAPNTPKKKFLTFAVVFAIAGGGYYAYSSFAAVSHVQTILITDHYNPARGENSKLMWYMDIPYGGGTTRAITIKKGNTIWVNTSKKISSTGRYSACYEIYNSKDNQLKFTVFSDSDLYSYGGATRLASQTHNIQGTKATQTRCVDFNVSTADKNKYIQFSYTPNNNNGVLYKVTLIKK